MRSRTSRGRAKKVVGILSVAMVEGNLLKEEGSGEGVMLKD